MKVVSVLCDILIKQYRIQAGKFTRKAITGKGSAGNSDHSSSTADYSGKTERCIHFSVDDTIEIFKDLTENRDRYKSMFEQPILSYLKELHENYGIRVLLYCFYEDEKGFELSQVTNRFSEEFLANASWLKTGFHGRNCHLLYDNATAEEAARDYEAVQHELQRICGGPAAITRVLRLSGFQGSRDAVLSMRDCSNGVTGLLTADDSRKSYYAETAFSSEKTVKMDGIFYYHTDLRIENCKWSRIRVPDKKNNFVVFTHEYYLLSKRMQLRMEKLFCSCVKQGRRFTFLE